MKRRWTALLTILLMFVMPACQSVYAPERPVQTDDAVVLKWWGAVPPDSGPNQVVENFNAIDPSVQVEYIYYNNDETGNTRLDISLLSPGEVDIFASYSNAALSRRIGSGAAAPLDDMLDAEEIHVEELYGANADYCRVDGVCYCLPSTRNNSCILYNQTMFDEAGIPRPTVGWTYEEFEAAAAALTQEGIYGYYYPAYSGGQPVTEYVQAKLGADWMYTGGGTGVNLNNPDLVRSFELYQERTAAGIEPDFVTNKTQRMTPQDMLLQEKAAMVYGTWILRYVKDTQCYPHDFVVGYASLPKLTENQDALHITSLTEYMSVSRNSRYAAEALGFIRWYITEGFGPMIEYGKIPAYQNYDQEEIVRLMFGGSEALFDLDEARQVLLTPAGPANKEYFLAAVEIDQILTEEFERAFCGSQSPAEAVSRAQSRAEAAILAAE